MAINAGVFQELGLGKLADSARREEPGDIVSKDLGVEEHKCAAKFSSGDCFVFSFFFRVEEREKHQ